MKVSSSSEIRCLGMTLLRIGNIGRDVATGEIRSKLLFPFSPRICNSYRDRAYEPF